MGIETLREIGIPEDVIEILVRCMSESPNASPSIFKAANSGRESWCFDGCDEKETPPQKCPNHRKPAKRLRRSKS